MTTAARRARLLAALGFLEIRWRGLKPDAAGALERWMYSWPGLGAVVDGMTAEGFEVELKEFRRVAGDVLPRGRAHFDHLRHGGGPHPLAGGPARGPSVLDPLVSEQVHARTRTATDGT